MYKTILGAALSATMLFGAIGVASASEAETCKQVRIAAGEWPDIQITQSMMALILNSLGYDANVTTLSIPVVFTSLKSKDIDVWMGNWMPSQTAELQPYLDDKSVEVVGTNLTGAKSGLAVPTYVADAGVKTLADLAANKDKFNGKIFGFEAGNDVNRHMMELIADPKNKLDGWEVVESSEAGMVTEAEKAIKHKEWIAFLPYSPHVAMGKMDLYYIPDVPDPSFGEATVYTNVRAGYLSECANVGTFFKNVQFSIPMLNEVMEYGETSKATPVDTAKHWMKSHTSEVQAWLKGVTTFDGKDAVDAFLGGLKAE